MCDENDEPEISQLGKDLVQKIEIDVQNAIDRVMALSDSAETQAAIATRALGSAAGIFVALLAEYNQGPVETRDLLHGMMDSLMDSFEAHLKHEAEKESA